MPDWKLNLDDLFEKKEADDAEFARALAQKKDGASCILQHGCSACF